MLEIDAIARTPLVAEALTSAGWTRGRAVEVDRWRAWFSRGGFTESPEVLEILESFGSLVIQPPEHPSAKFRSGTIRFDPEWAWPEQRTDLAERERDLGHALWPIAEWSDVYALLYADNGAVYADGANLGVLLVGETFVEALILMITAEREPILVIE